MKRARARLTDILRVVSASLCAVMMAALRRLMGRRRRSGWSLGYELTVAAYRGSWSVMPKLGVVRWRRVGEDLSSLRTDGLAPRFVRGEIGASGIDGVWLEPAHATGAVMLYFHGGGFVFGSLRTHGDLIGALARATGARTLAIEYRLGPEDPVREFSGRAQAAGVELRLSVYDEMVHVWHMLRAVAPEAQQAIDEVGAFVREHAD